MREPQFLGLSTGRAGSRYLAEQLNAIGIGCVHEVTRTPPQWRQTRDIIGEVSAQLVVATKSFWPNAHVIHFYRHPAHCVAGLLEFGFWRKTVGTIHPHLADPSGDILADTYRYWLDWNLRIMALPNPATRFRIEDTCAAELYSVAKDMDVTALNPDLVQVTLYVETREPAPPPPESVRAEVIVLAEEMGYDTQCLR